MPDLFVASFHTPNDPLKQCPIRRDIGLNADRGVWFWNVPFEKMSHFPGHWGRPRKIEPGLAGERRHE